jgi:hypothetical protein
VLALLVGVPELSLGGFVLYSEYPTWIAILFAFPLVVAARGTRAAVAASLLLGLAIFLRGDQAVGVAALLAVALYRFAWRERTSRAALVRGSAAVLVPVMALALLPALHNAVYGHTVAFLAQTPRLPENFPLPPSALLHLQRSGTLDVLRSQVAGVLVLPEVDAKAHVRALLRVVAVLVQLGVVGVVVAAVTRRLAVPRRVMWLLALPAAYLLVHVFVQVYVYYPRHVLVGYLTAALTLVAVAGCHLAARVASEIEPVSRRRARAASGGRSRR